MDKISPSQDAFARRIARGDNGTDAALAAGYSRNSAQAKASQLLSKPAIQEWINYYKENPPNEEIDISGIAQPEKFLLLVQQGKYSPDKYQIEAAKALLAYKLAKLRSVKKEDPKTTAKRQKQSAEKAALNAFAAMPAPKGVNIQ